MQTTTTPTKPSVFPPHVRPEQVFDYDYIADAELLKDPHQRMRSLVLEAPPIFYSPHHGGHWMVTSRPILMEIVADTTLYSNKSRGIPAADHDINLIPLTLDPPEHTVYRMPLNKLMSIKAVAEFEEVIRSMSNALIDAVADAQGCDFLHSVAEPLPVTLFLKMAGMPTDRLAEFRQIAEDATASADKAVRAKAFMRIVEILEDTIRDRQKVRQDDLISRLLDADVGGRNPTFEEMQSYVTLLFLGGLETVVNALSFSVRYLAMNPELQDQLRRDPTLLKAAVEELFRLHGIASTVRVVTRDTECHGVSFKKGESIYLLLPAANFDTQAHAEPGSFVLGRTQPHMTFNSGPHRCIGANLARLELRVFLEIWLQRIPSFRLDPDKPARFAGGMNLAVKSLPLVWS